MKKETQAFLLKGNELSFDEIMLYAERIRKDGNVFLVKLDGGRSLGEEQYTAVIGFPNDPEKNVIRADTSTLKEACLNVLKQYFRTHNF